MKIKKEYNLPKICHYIENDRDKYVKFNYKYVLDERIDHIKAEIYDSKYNYFIHSLIDLIDSLYVDDIFDIYNRNGIIRKITTSVVPLKVYFTDYNKISKLNKKYGYNKVNEMFKKTFDELKKYNLSIGRCFSGDEIIFLTRNYENDYIDLIKSVSKKNGLTFKYTCDIYYPKPLNEFLPDDGLKFINNIVDKFNNEIHNSKIT